MHDQKLGRVSVENCQPEVRLEMAWTTRVQTIPSFTPILSCVFTFLALVIE